MNMEKSAGRFKIFDTAQKCGCIFWISTTKRKIFLHIINNSLRKEEENL